RGRALAVLAATFEIDPAFIEAVDHTHPWHGVFHALRAKKRFPSVTRHRVDPHVAAKSGSKRGSDVTGGITPRPFQLDQPNPIPGIARVQRPCDRYRPWRPSGWRGQAAARSWGQRQTAPPPRPRQRSP